MGAGCRDIVADVLEGQHHRAEWQAHAVALALTRPEAGRPLQHQQLVSMNEL